jgi:ribosomal protein S18 acetylase RimI-like enzyme
VISKLNNSAEDVAKRIHRIFQNSYKVEAELIGTQSFPPLARTAKDIANSETSFYGYSENNDLAAIIEIAIDAGHLEIHSLTVDPAHFRKGIADKLIDYTLNSFDFSEAIVETALVNVPAISLYKKHGFVEFKQFTPSHGIEKLAFVFESNR